MGDSKNSTAIAPPRPPSKRSSTVECSHEESSWTKYFEDLLVSGNYDSADSDTTSSGTSSLISDASSRPVINKKKSGDVRTRVSRCRNNLKKRKIVDHEDTATSSF